MRCSSTHFGKYINTVQQAVGVMTRQWQAVAKQVYAVVWFVLGLLVFLLGISFSRGGGYLFVIDSPAAALRGFLILCTIAALHVGPGILLWTRHRVAWLFALIAGLFDSTALAVLLWHRDALWSPVQTGTVVTLLVFFLAAIGIFSVWREP